MNLQQLITTLQFVSQYSSTVLTPDIEDEYAEGHSNGYNDCVRNMIEDLVESIKDEVSKPR